MRKKDHLKSAEEMEESARALAEEDPEKHVKVIAEAIFGAAHHYLAYGLEDKLGEHLDKHSGVPSLLRKHGFGEEASCFEKLDSIRAGRFYGRKGNSEAVREAFDLLQRIKRWAR